MIAGIQVKICGLTSLADAGLADEAGADYLGFVLYAGSPRRVTLEAWQTMAPRLPARKKVAVMVEPAPAELAEAAEIGFDFFQVHFADDGAAPVAAWSATVGPGRLWLAPRLETGRDVTDHLLLRAETFLLDANQPDLYGGTGRTGDWAQYRRLRETHPEKNWILAGGLNSENIGAALAATGARWVDLSSGVEAAPGVKDPTKLQAFAERLRLAVRAG